MRHVAASGQLKGTPCPLGLGSRKTQIDGDTAVTRIPRATAKSRTHRRTARAMGIARSRAWRSSSPTGCRGAALPRMANERATEFGGELIARRLLLSVPAFARTLIWAAPLATLWNDEGSLPKANGAGLRVARRQSRSVEAIRSIAARSSP